MSINLLAIIVCYGALERYGNANTFVLSWANAMRL